MNQKKITMLVFCVILFSFLNAPDLSAAAAKKQTRVVTVQKPNVPQIPAKRVLNDFADAYKPPPDSKTLKIEYNKKVRNFNEPKGEGQVPAQAHEVSNTLMLTDCGIKMREIWELYYYKLETEWIFKDIKRVKSTRLTIPAKKLPAIDALEMKKMILNFIMKSYQRVTVQEITVLNTKGYWDLCTPTYKTISKITIVTKDDIRNTVSTYECQIATILAQHGGNWEPVMNSCIYRGKEIEQCHFGTFCLKISSVSSVPEVSENEALVLMRESFEKEYAARRNNAVIEKFSIAKLLPYEGYGTKLPCVISASFVMDENKEEFINDAGNRRRSYRQVRAVYDCIIYGHLQYTMSNRKWQGVIDSCCASENDRCGKTCENPSKWCKRLGEK